MGVVNAVTCADLTLAGVKSFILADEVFDAMKSISKNMGDTIQETAKGGLAVTPTALALALQDRCLVLYSSAL